MSTQYRDFQNDNNQDGFSALLESASDMFKAEHRMNILGEGIKDIITDKVAFNDYVEKLTEGLDATESKQVEQLFRNARVQTLQESVAGIQPHASLTMPVIRKMWARIALKYAIPTEPVKVPAFSVAFTSPYVLNPDGTKTPLPTAINGVTPDIMNPVSNTRVDMAKQADLTIDTVKGLKADGLQKGLVPVKYPRNNIGEFGTKVDPIHHKLDKSAMIARVAVKFNDTVDFTAIVEPRLKADLYGRLYKEMIVDAVDADENVKQVKVILMGSFDFENCKVMLFANVLKESAEGSANFDTAIAGAEVAFVVDGFFTHETHNESVNVAISIFKRDIEIGTGTHIENSLQLEFLQDAMAMYSIDGAAETIDVMSNVVAQKLDVEIYQFLVNSAARLTMDPDSDSYNGAGFHAEFDVKPSAGYTGSPKEWREELKTVIDHFAIKMKSTKFFYNGYFCIIGNPLDTALIPNVNWTFNKITDDQNGVEVEYSVGAMSGSQRYTVVASDLIPDGQLIMFFVPTTNKYITYKYYPYTFNVVHDYRNALINNVPSIMMTKRHTIEEFTPLICTIDILGNNGSIPQWGARTDIDLNSPR